MTWTNVPASARKFVAWDPYISRPISTKWDGQHTVWDGGATTWDSGDTTWEDPKTIWSE